MYCPAYPENDQVSGLQYDMICKFQKTEANCKDDSLTMPGAYCTWNSNTGAACTSDADCETVGPKLDLTWTLASPTSGKCTSNTCGGCSLDRSKIQDPEAHAQLPLIATSATTFKLHDNQLAGSKSFEYCWSKFHQWHSLANTYGGRGTFVKDDSVATSRSILWKTYPDGSKKLEITRIEMNADYLEYGADFVNLIQDVRQALLVDTKLTGSAESKTDGDIFPLGIPFIFWEQYVELPDNMVSTSTYAGVVVLLTVTILLVILNVEKADSLPILIIASLHSAVLVLVLCFVSMIQMYGFMGLMSIKLNAIPQVTLVMCIGITVEFTAHMVLAFLNAPNPASSPNWSFASRKARAQQALAITAMPIIHGGITTFLGIVMLANADTEFIVLYYFMLYFLLVIFGIINGLFVLPAFLVLFGPVAVCSENGNTVVASGTVVPVEKQVANSEIEKELEQAPQLET